MTKYLLAAAAAAAIAISGAAFAQDGKATSTAPKAMSDSEMDKVTAGSIPEFTSQGGGTAADAGGNAYGFIFNTHNQGIGTCNSPSGCAQHTPNPYTP